MAMADKACITSIQSSTPYTVTLPDGSTATSTHTGLLNLPQLPMAARECHLFPSFRGSLISIGLLCDHGMTATFNATSVTIAHNGHPVLRGHRSPAFPMWMFQLDPSPSAATVQPTSMGSPAVSTLLNAVRCGYVRLPGLTVSAIRRHPPMAIATAKGHLDRNRQGQHSTRAPDPSDDTFPPTKTTSTSQVYTRFYDTCGKQFIDLTGRFPIPSDDGSEYLLLFYAVDPNYIHVEPVTARSATAIGRAFRSGHSWFADHRVTTSYLHLDNETSTELRTYCAKEDITLQYCPPNNHRANKAERCIRSFKNHFISILSATDPSFPLTAWNHLIPIGEMTLNMLRGSNTNPLISGWEQLHGPYDYNAHPLAPPGIKVLAFEDPTMRESWSPHGREGFYIGPALDHYRCHRIYLTDTKRVRIVDTCSWHPSHLLLPGPSPMDDLSAATRDLSSAFQRCADTPHILVNQRQPLASIGESLTTALTQLHDTFQPTPDPIPPLQRVVATNHDHSMTSAPSLLPSAVPPDITSPIQRVDQAPVIPTSELESDYEVEAVLDHRVKKCSKQKTGSKPKSDIIEYIGCCGRAIPSTRLHGYLPQTPLMMPSMITTA